MKETLLMIVLLISLPMGRGILTRATESFQEDAYKESLEMYKKALPKYEDQGAFILYNIAQCYLKLDSTNKAMHFFRRAVDADNPEIAGRAANQLGVLLSKKGEKKEALRFFKRALVDFPQYEPARFNYELTYRELDLDQPADDEDEDPSLDNPWDDNDNNQDQNLDEEYLKLLQQLYKQRSSEINNDLAQPVDLDTLPLPVARELLEKMRKENPQFLQQLRKNAPNVPREQNRPDW